MPGYRLEGKDLRVTLVNTYKRLLDLKQGSSPLIIDEHDQFHWHGNGGMGNTVTTLLPDALQLEASKLLSKGEYIAEPEVFFLPLENPGDESKTGLVSVRRVKLVE